MASLHMEGYNAQPKFKFAAHAIKFGHFKKMCRSKGIVSEVKTDQEEFLGVIHVDTADTDHKEKPWTTTLELNE